MTPTCYNSTSVTDKITTAAATPSSSSSFIDTSIFTESTTTADILNNALENDLIDLTTNAPADDLFTADIDFMNNYLKSLPDYSNNGSNISSTVKLREHPNPKPYHNVFNDSHVQFQKHGVSQSPQFHRKPVRIPLSKSSSLHTFTKHNMQKGYGNIQPPLPMNGTSQINYHEKELCAADDVQNNVISNNTNNNKISRSTSSNSMINANDPNAVATAKEGSDFMGFMKKPSSLINIFKKLGGSQSNSFSPQQQAQQNSPQENVVHKCSKTPSVEPKKSISDFWRDNVTSNSQHAPKFGWNYHKIIPQFTHKSSSQPQPQPQPQQQPQQVQSNSTKPFPSPSSAKRKMNVTSKPVATVSNSSSSSVAITSSNSSTIPATSKQPIFQATKSRDSQPKKENISIQESPKLRHRQQSSHENVNKFEQQPSRQQEFQNHKAFESHHLNSNNNGSTKIRENLKMAKEEFFKGTPASGNNNSSQTNNNAKPSQELIKSSSNSHIYMNDQDPNYFRNLHKITKSLNNNVTNLIVNKPPSQQQAQNQPIPLHKSMSNSSVPNYHHSHLPHNFHHHHHPHHPPILYPTNFQPSSAPVHGPAFIYPAYPSTHDMQMLQKSNVPICYKYSLNKSSSNSSMGPATFGFYSLSEKPAFTTASGIPVLWPKPTTPASTTTTAAAAQQQSKQHINKSSSSSCIYAKTLSQPAHLSKNNGIFARYKPILSDDDDSDASDDDISKHSSISYVNNVPAPPPFTNRKNSMPNSGSCNSINTVNNFTPFTKISTIQIPINGQLPPPFKCKNAAMALERQEEQKSLTNAVDSSSSDCVHKTVCDQQQQQQKKHELQPQQIQASNIFYNLMSNPLTATQNAIAINQSQQNVQLQDGHPHTAGAFASVGVIGGEQIYTPYTKYLSDRKYFADLNVCGESSQIHTTTAIGESQRRNSGPSTCTNKSKIPMYVENKPKQITKEQQHASPAVINTPVTQSSTTVQTSSEKTSCGGVNKKEDDEIDILSAFDPFYVPSDSQPQPKQNTSSTTTTTTSNNKLHQLLSSVVNEQWTDYKKCDAYGSDLHFCKEKAEVVWIIFFCVLVLDIFFPWLLCTICCGLVDGNAVFLITCELHNAFE